MTLTEIMFVPDSLAEARQVLLQRAKSIFGNGTEGVNADVIRNIGVLETKRAKPHVDDDFLEWTVLWVLQSNGHMLSTADHRPLYQTTSRRPLRAKGLVHVPLTVGEAVLFNAHRTHWMDAASDHSMMISAFFDFRDRPTQKQAVDRIIADTDDLLKV